MKIVQIAFILVVFLVLGCNDEQRNLSGTLPVKQNLTFVVNKEEQTMSFDTLFRNKQMIPLEETEESLIANVSKIQIYKDNIYVMDFSKDLSIAVFDKTGKFKFKLKQIGRGPQEYYSISDANVNEFSGDIELLVNSDRKLMIYDSTGAYVKTLKSSFGGTYFSITENSRFFYKGNTEFDKSKYSFRLYQTNLDGEVIGKYLWYKVNLGKGQNYYRDVFSQIRLGEYYFNESYNDTIYKISDKGITPKIKIDFKGAKNFPKDFFTDNQKYPDKIAYAEKQGIPSLSSFHDYENYFIGVYNQYKEETEYAYSYIYDKQKEKIIHNINSIYSKELGINIMAGDVLPRYGKTKNPIGFIYPYEIEEYFLNDESLQNINKKNKALSNYFKYRKSSENPIVILYKNRGRQTNITPNQ